MAAAEANASAAGTPSPADEPGLSSRLALMSGAPLLPLTSRVREKDTLIGGILSVRTQHGFLGMRPWVSRYFVISHVDLTLRRYGNMDEARVASKTPKVYRLWGCERIVVQEGGKFKLRFDMSVIYAAAAASITSSKDTELADGWLELNADTHSERQNWLCFLVTLMIHMTGKPVAEFLSSEDAAHPDASTLLPPELPTIPSNAHAYAEFNAKEAPRPLSVASTGTDAAKTMRRKMSLAATRQKAADKMTEAWLAQEEAARVAAEAERAHAQEEARKQEKKKSALAATKSKAAMRRQSSKEGGGDASDLGDLDAQPVQEEGDDSDTEHATSIDGTESGCSSPAARAVPPTRPKSMSGASVVSLPPAMAAKSPLLSEAVREQVSSNTAESDRSERGSPTPPARPSSRRLQPLPAAPTPPVQSAPAAEPAPATLPKPDTDSSAVASAAPPDLKPAAPKPPTSAAATAPPPAAASASASSSDGAAPVFSGGYQAPEGETAAEKRERMNASIRRLRARLLMILRFTASSERSLGRPMTVEEKRARLMRTFKQDTHKRSNQRDNLRADISAMRMGARVTALTDAVKRFQRVHARGGEGGGAGDRFTPPAGETPLQKALRIKTCMWRIKWCMRLIISMVRETERAQGRVLTSAEKARAVIARV